jgi:ribosomal protein S9
VNSTARAADALEAFQNHCVRIQWDTLLSQAGVEGGGTISQWAAIGCGFNRSMQQIG